MIKCLSILETTQVLLDIPKYYKKKVKMNGGNNMNIAYINSLLLWITITTSIVLPYLVILTLKKNAKSSTKYI